MPVEPLFRPRLGLAGVQVAARGEQIEAALAEISAINAELAMRHLEACQPTDLSAELPGADRAPAPNWWI